MRYERIIAIFFVLIAVFFCIFIIKYMEIRRASEPVTDAVRISGGSDVDSLKKDIIALKVKLENLERVVRSEKAPSQEPNAPVSEGVEDRFITENVNRDNLNTKATWNQTNRSGLYIVNIALEKEPFEKTILVWTGLGLLPASGYNVNGKTLSVILQQTREEFMSGNNFINIRYIAKPDSV